MNIFKFLITVIGCTSFMVYAEPARDQHAETKVQHTVKKSDGHNNIVHKEHKEQIMRHETTAYPHNTNAAQIIDRQSTARSVPHRRGTVVRTPRTVVSVPANQRVRTHSDIGSVIRSTIHVGAKTLDDVLNSAWVRLPLISLAGAQAYSIVAETPDTTLVGEKLEALVSSKNNSWIITLIAAVVFGKLATYTKEALEAARLDYYVDYDQAELVAE